MKPLPKKLSDRIEAYRIGEIAKGLSLNSARNRHIGATTIATELYQELQEVMGTLEWYSKNAKDIHSMSFDPFDYGTRADKAIARLDEKFGKEGE